MRQPRTIAQLQTAIVNGPVIARGNGRAYGDSALNPDATIDMLRFNHMLSFDRASGILVAQGGVLLSDVIETFLPLGWFPLVTPGTKFVTLGGMAAADVHGKNHHHDGSFRNCVEWLDIMLPSGEVQRCSSNINATTFEETFGAMGLTGIITCLAIKLRPVETCWIKQSTIAAPDLLSVMALFDANDTATYSVAWIDCLAKGKKLGRSVLMLGEHATRYDLPDTQDPMQGAKARKTRLNIPFAPPVSLLNPLSNKVFNNAYYHANARRSGTILVNWDSYFYPLDTIGRWNLIYGRRGFIQHQCVIPLAQSQSALTQILERISSQGQGSFLAVLKKFGHQSGKWSFPMPGYTLTLDFPATASALLLREQLDQIVLAHGGRFYLAKDATMSAETLFKSDARMSALADSRHDNGQTSRFCSLQSRRLGL